MDVVPHGRYRAMAVSPLTAGRLDPPDICLIYGTPGQMILFINGLQWTGYRKLSLHLGRRVGVRGLVGQGAQDRRAGAHDSVLRRAALRRRGRRRAADGAFPRASCRRSSTASPRSIRNGLRYPIPPYGIQSDAGAGLAVSYAGKEKKVDHAARCDSARWSASFAALFAPARAP